MSPVLLVIPKDVPDGEAVVVGELVVPFPGHLLRIRPRPQVQPHVVGVRRVPRRGIRLGIVLPVIQRDGIQPAGGNDVPGKLRPEESSAVGVLACREGIEDRNRPAVRRGEVQEVPAPLLVRRRRSDGRVTQSQVVLLVIVEEEGLVLDHGAADRAAVLVVADRGLDSGERVARIQGIVPEMPVGRPAKLVGPGLGHQVDDTPKGVAILSGHGAAFDLELLDRVHGGIHVVVSAAIVDVRGAVDRDVVPARRATVNAESRDQHAAIRESGRLRRREAHVGREDDQG